MSHPLTDASRLHARRVLRTLAASPLTSLEGFLRFWVHNIVRRPLLVQGMLLSPKGTEEAPPAPGYLVLVDDALGTEEAGRTVMHELAHLMLLLAGIPPQFHDETEVEACACAMFKNEPRVLEIVVRVFPSFHRP